MVVQVLERKPNNEESGDSNANFESKYLIQNGNYVKFSTSIDTLFRNVRPATSKTTTSKNEVFYEIINNKVDKNDDGTNYETTGKENDDGGLGEDDQLSMWIDSKDLYCSCPKIRLRRKYLVMSKSSNLLRYLLQQPLAASTSVDNKSIEDETSYDDDDNNDIRVNYELDEGKSSRNESTSRLRSRQTQLDAATRGGNSINSTSISVGQENAASVKRFAGLLVDRETTIIEWRPNYTRRLRRFVRYYQSGKCS